jgi:N-acetylmuramoyl-L-alanine amidase/TAT (twin-arginine translocation) pathway signal sequence
MCDHCHLISRRDLLKGATAAIAAAGLVSCASDQAVDQLPDPIHDHVEDEFGPPVVIDRSRIVVPTAQPPQPSEYGFIMPRTAWTNSPLELRNGVPMDGVNRITIHHSGDGKPFLGESVADVARHLQVVQQGHLQRGMIDIAYHFALDRTGRVWQLRWLKYEGQHVRNNANGMRNNPHNVGVVMLGDFNLQPATAASRDRLFEIVRLIRSKYMLSASAVFMHGELVQTDCPGKSLRPVILDGRKRNAF